MLLCASPERRQASYRMLHPGFRDDARASPPGSRRHQHTAALSAVVLRYALRGPSAATSRAADGLAGKGVLEGHAL